VEAIGSMIQAPMHGLRVGLIGRWLPAGRSNAQTARTSRTARTARTLRTARVGVSLCLMCSNGLWSVTACRSACVRVAGVAGVAAVAGVAGVAGVGVGVGVGAHDWRGCVRGEGWLAACLSLGAVLAMNAVVRAWVPRDLSEIARPVWSGDVGGYPTSMVFAVMPFSRFTRRAWVPLDPPRVGAPGSISPSRCGRDCDDRSRRHDVAGIDRMGRGAWGVECGPRGPCSRLRPVQRT
jgi:hypothetical protein